MIRLPRLRRLAPSLARAIVAGCITVAGCVQETKPPPPKIRYAHLPGEKGLPALLAGTIRDRTLMGNETPYSVTAYGLVGQPRGTADCTAPASVRSYMSR